MRAARIDAVEAEGPETNGKAIASLFLGIFWLFGFGSLAAIVLGISADREIRASAGRQSGRAFAIGGIVSGVFGLISVGFVIAIAAFA